MKRLITLDFLRGIAVILVLFRHFYFFPPLFDAGWIGVDLFFVLSGYLVSGLLFKEYIKTGRVRVGRFLIRRGFKIYPLFFFAILVTAILEFNIYDGIPFYDLISEILFVQNYFGNFWNHTWSLAIEEHFYIAVAIIIFIIVRLKKLEKRKAILIGAVLLLVLALVLRVVNFSNPYDYKTHLFPTHLRFDSLLFGMILSYIHHFGFTEKIKIGLNKYAFIWLILGLGLISPAFIFKVDSMFMSTIGLTFLYLGFGLILFLLVTLNKGESTLFKFFSKPLVVLTSKIGYYSYGIYLFHMFVVRYVIGGMHDSGFKMDYKIEFVFYFILSVVLGALFSYLVEIPMLKIRDKIFPRST